MPDGKWHVKRFEQQFRKQVSPGCRPGLTCTTSLYWLGAVIAAAVTTIRACVCTHEALFQLRDPSSWGSRLDRIAYLIAGYAVPASFTSDRSVSRVDSSDHHSRLRRPGSFNRLAVLSLGPCSPALLGCQLRLPVAPIRRAFPPLLMASGGLAPLSAGQSLPSISALTLVRRSGLTPPAVWYHHLAGWVFLALAPPVYRR
jgi:hypothetical protein